MDYDLDEDAVFCTILEICKNNNVSDHDLIKSLYREVLRLRVLLLERTD